MVNETVDINFAEPYVEEWDNGKGTYVPRQLTKVELANIKRTLNTQVKKGMEFLDTKFPGWEDEVDLGILDMSDGRLCMLGQLGGRHAVELGFDVAYTTEGGKYAFVAYEEDPKDAYQVTFAEIAEVLEEKYASFDAEHTGFQAGSGAVFPGLSSYFIYDMLNTAWKKKIRERVNAKRKVVSA